MPPRKVPRVTSLQIKSTAAFSRQALPSPPPKKRRKLDIDNLSDRRVVEKASEAWKSAVLVVETRPNTGDTTDIKHALENLERDTMGESWYDALQGEFKKSYFHKLKTFLLAEHKSQTIYPAVRDIYSWSRLTPLQSVKVIIIGQDPYHDVDQAHGLAFSVLSPTKPPPSLKNIYKQIKDDIPSFVIPSSGDLTPLAKSGVLFLNTCLTVRAHKAHSHARKGWEELTTAALRAVVNRKAANDDDDKRGVVVLAWGLPAQKTCLAVGIDENKHLVLKSAHPSPLSAYRGFFGNMHFKQANAWLESRYGPGQGVDWTALNASKATALLEPNSI